MSKVLDKVKIFSKDRKNVLSLLFFLFLSVGLFSISVYVVNREKSFDTRSSASVLGTTGVLSSLPVEYRKGDLNDDNKVSMEDFGLWLRFYRIFKAGSGLTDISAGSYHTCGLGSDNNAYCWGYNSRGQLGNGSSTDSNVPVQVSAGAIPSGVTLKNISLGGYHTCGIGSDSKVYCWGRNEQGQLGNGSSTDSNVPVQVSAGAIPSGVTLKNISLGGYHTCGIGSDSKVYCWGYNGQGELGNGSTTDSEVPVLVNAGAIPSGVTLKNISLGGYHTCGLGSDNNAYCWGNNSRGQLGNGSSTDSNVPVQVSAGAIPSGVTLKNISLGDYHTCGLGSDNNAYCWGYNSRGQLGNGSTTDSEVPVLVNAGAIPSGVTLKNISLGGYHTCGLGSDNNAYCWGNNSRGQLGNGSSTDSNVPVQVSAGAIPSGVTLKNISLGFYHTCGIGSDGHGYCWGGNGEGQLGNGSKTDSEVPVVVQDSPLEADMDSDGKVTMTDFSLWLGIYREYKATKTTVSNGIYWSLDDAKLNDRMKVFPLKSVGEQQLELVQGKKGNGVKFSGKKGYRLEYKNSNPDLFKQQNLTVMAYIKLSEGDCGYDGICAIVSKGSSGYRGFILTIKDSKAQFYINDSVEERSRAVGSTTLQKNIWYHIAGTYNKSDGKLNVYVNGILDGSATNTGPVNYGEANFWIGNANNNIDLQFNGVIDEVRFFDRVLTKSEIGSYVLK